MKVTPPITKAALERVIAQLKAPSNNRRGYQPHVTIVPPDFYDEIMTEGGIEAWAAKYPVVLTEEEKAWLREMI